jgi:hypothetical protein
MRYRCFAPLAVKHIPSYLTYAGEIGNAFFCDLSHRLCPCVLLVAVLL